MSNLGERLKIVSEERKLSYEKLGALVGVSKQAISDIINGKTANPRSEIIFGIADRLFINLEWLINGKGQMEIPNITTESKDPVVKELIKQVNFLQNQIEKKDEQIEKKDELIKAFTEKFLKLKAIEPEPLKGGAVVIEMFPVEEDNSFQMLA